MENPKTTMAGWLTVTGTLLAGVGQVSGGKIGHWVTLIGLGLAGAGAGIGNLHAKDGAP